MQSSGQAAKVKVVEGATSLYVLPVSAAAARKFLILEFRPSAETAKAAALAVALIAVLGFLNTLVLVRLGRNVSGSAATALYLLAYLLVVRFARRRGNLAAIGVTAHRALIGTAVGLLIGALGVAGTTKLFPEGSFAAPSWQALLTLVVTGSSVGFIENAMLHGYFQFRMAEAFGPAAAVVVSAIIWTLFHAMVLATAGAGTYAAERLGTISFLANLFVTFLIVGLAVQVTHNIWAGVAQNALMGNVAVNLHMLSVMPNKVLIADPKSLPVAFLLAIAVIAGLLLGRG